MSAADRREELEALLWRIRAEYPAIVSILAAADRYAEAVADERITGHVQDRTLGPGRLAAAVSDYARHDRRAS